MKKTVYETFKKNFLLRKVENYFSTNPKSNSVIVSYDVKGDKTIWKVVKESKGFNITEVTSSKKQFLIEAPVPYDPDKTTVSPPPLPQRVTPTQIQPPALPKQAQVTLPGSAPLAQPMTDPSQDVQPVATDAQRQQDITSTQQTLKWDPANANGSFTQTLSQTKDLGQTLNTMYIDIMQQSQNNEQNALNVVNRHLSPAGVQIRSKDELMNPATRSKVSAWLRQQYPNLDPSAFRESKKPVKHKNKLKEAEDPNQHLAAVQSKIRMSAPPLDVDKKKTIPHQINSSPQTQTLKK